MKKRTSKLIKSKKEKEKIRRDRKITQLKRTAQFKMPDGSS